MRSQVLPMTAFSGGLGDPRAVVESALRNTATPMGVAESLHLEKLPVERKGSLPAIEDLEAE